jgi:hypothetical protein
MTKPNNSTKQQTIKLGYTIQVHKTKQDKKKKKKKRKEKKRKKEVA